MSVKMHRSNGYLYFTFTSEIEVFAISLKCLFLRVVQYLDSMNIQFSEIEKETIPLKKLAPKCLII